MSTDVLNYDLHKTIRLLPGYDPFDQAEGYWFDEDAALFAIDFVESQCTLTKGTKDGRPLAATPFILEGWQKAIVGNIFGWREQRDDDVFMRRYKECLLFVPRKNGKSELAAAIVVLMLYSSAGFLNQLPAEPGAEGYGAAGKQDQTKYIFDPVKKMILANPTLAGMAQVYKHSIVVGDASYLKISSEATTEHGGSTHIAVVDELHAQPTPELVEVLETSTTSREQPLLLYVTTSDHEREGSVCNDKHDYACAVRDNGGDRNKPGYDPEFLPIIYGANKEDDWTDPDVWRAANPNYGVSVRPGYMERACRKAIEDPGRQNSFLRLNLNIRTQSSNQWITEEKWDACLADIRIQDYAGKPCWLAIDVASTEDFNAALFVFRDDCEEAVRPIAAEQKDDPDDLDDSNAPPPLHPSVRVAIFPYFWVPEATAVKRERQKRIPYSVWAQGGHLTLCPEAVIGSARLTRDITRIVDDNKLRVVEMPVDRAFQGMDVILAMVAVGFESFAHTQGPLGMIGPTKQTKNLIYSRNLRHAGSPVMRWMMNNVVVHAGDNKEYPMRDKSADKIDGPVAMIMGVSRAVLNDVPPTSPYNSRGFLTT